MLSAGIDLKTVKEILGHTDIRTTEIYAQVLAETMPKEMQKLNYD
jgi:site-specific recombinase XerD